ncbi:MAG TPA: hypothetical protein PKA28_15755 [Methylomusa anaerophila]|uniref:Uncharacterized protein n=1 Tax=Methylomusa anaerophila TaxID=1930071 RepID=A0A348AKB6_9FIRM|nr:hypothetical protein [Methylomusa anaerophila]BBB91514.1 hypothetical protein MAMMFC1_02198 [Methylomusa anaerophila]HML89899.1 hypothetical protein [Methylomusa anaerophila]
MKLFKKVWIVLALVMAFATTAWANSAYTVVNSGYSQGKVGTITSTGSVTPSAVSTPLNGAPAVHSFTDANGQPRMLVYNYTAATGNPEVLIYNPATSPWTQVKSIADLAGANIVNLYGIATSGSYLYAVDYDTAKIVQINMAGDAYSVTATYTFPGTTGYEKHGVAIAAVGDYVYGLFTEVDDDYATNPNYLTSKVVKLNKSTLAAVGTAAQVGKNAFTLKSYNNKLYVAAVGGKQRDDGTYNSGESKLNVVNLADMTVATPFTSGTAIPYEFRDITLSTAGDAYLLVGRYTPGYATMTGKVYKTTATAIASGSLGTEKQSFNTAGYYWALLYETAADRLWFAQGNQVDLRIASTYTSIVSLPAQTILGGSQYPNLNSVALIGQAGATLQGYQDPALPGVQSGLKAARKIKTTK